MNNINQFAKYEYQLKSIPNKSKSNKATISNITNTLNDFNQILNNIFCTYSFPKGKTKWREISSTIPNQFRQNPISLEIYHVESGHEIDQARLAVKNEMEKYIEWLVGNSSN